MFQSFESPSDPSHGGQRIEELRATFERLGIDGCIVPHADEHQGEDQPACSMRLAWLTGFSGSAGQALILEDSAHIFVDGRYRLQARHQLDASLFTIHDISETTLFAFLEKNLGAGTRVGFDPFVHSVREVERLEKAAAASGTVLVALETNPVDAIWTQRPAQPNGAVSIHEERFVGVLAKEKLVSIVEALREAGADALFLSEPASIAWLFNIRGGDIPRTPTTLAYAHIPAEGMPTLFIDPAKLGVREQAYLNQLADLADPASLRDRTMDLFAGKAVLIDPDMVPVGFARLIESAGGRMIRSVDPVRLKRAVKNPVEIAGMREAHRRDGVAMVAFLAWLDDQRPDTVDEITVVTKLEEARRATGERMEMPLHDIAFNTIAGSAGNGAIIHYRVSESSNRTLGEGELLLLDSGAQYRDGTTDITRTISIGAPGEEMRRHFTLVLKAMIAVSTLRFPKATKGREIDPIARMHLWKHGFDYAHGTGHGVGSFLSVHEGPQSLSRHGAQELLPGMIVSNEPGYYREDAYGIRIENLLLATEPEDFEGGDAPMMSFETLTLCPFDRRLIMLDLLTSGERVWIDAYHARILKEIGDLVEFDAVRHWLRQETRPL